MRAGFLLEVGTRRAQAISKTVLAVRATMNAEMIRQSASAWAASLLLLSARLKRTLAHRRDVTPAVVEQARQLIAREIAPITDLRSTEHYRRTVTGNVLAKFLRQISN